MQRWQNTILLFRLALLGFLVYFLLSGMPALIRYRLSLDAPPPPKPFEPYSWVDPSKGLRILSFYGFPARVMPGEAVSLCYGVAGAAKVRLEPPVAEITPSFNRCIEVRPRKSTRYTLIAADAAGRELRQSFEMPVGPPPHAP